MRIFLLILPLAVAACAPDAGNSHAAQTQPVAPAVAKTPTDEGLLARARTRWAAIDKEDWIEAYNFISPDVRKVNPISKYLQGKENHRYDNPVVESVFSKDEAKGVAYVRSRVLWTPQHPQLKTLKLDPGQTLTEEVPIVESWKWIQNDWYFVEQEGADKFFEAHPELLRAPQPQPQAGQGK